MKSLECQRLLYTLCEKDCWQPCWEILSLPVNWFKHHRYNSFQIQSDCVCYSSYSRITSSEVPGRDTDKQTWLSSSSQVAGSLGHSDQLLLLHRRHPLIFPCPWRSDTQMHEMEATSLVRPFLICIQPKYALPSSLHMHTRTCRMLRPSVYTRHGDEGVGSRHQGFEPSRLCCFSLCDFRWVT